MIAPQSLPLQIALKEWAELVPTIHSTGPSE
jgi:hypothetical protein